ncbi:unnamed protein product [Auanema sp. JU1783]|nr:unnamed protein product [Auanema sp. JU1783]
MAENVVIYLAKQKSLAKNNIADNWHKLEELYAKKLWHPLTKEVRSLINNSEFTTDLNLKDFYDNFISEFELRISPIQLVEIALPVSSFIFKTNIEEAYAFLGRLKNKVLKDKVAVARVHTGEIDLRLNNRGAQEAVIDIKHIRDMIESTQKEVDDLNGVTEVHAPFYKVSALYLREVGDFAGYYREALRYLGVEDPDSLSRQEKHVQALLVGFAALLGVNVYNFGELLAHPILKSLEETSESWLIPVLYAFNSGDLVKFHEMEKHWGEWKDLKKKKDFLVCKIRLMAVMEIALARPSKERNIPFSEIAAKCQVGVEEVEFLVMRALSKGLIKGLIDQVNQTVHITWVQPRVLNSDQILLMCDRMTLWRRDVTAIENIVHENAREILTKS